MRAYLAAHAHQWRYTASMPPPLGPAKVPQIIAGNGGRAPDKGWVASGNDFGYTLVSVLGSGKVTAKSFGRPIAATCYQQQPTPSPAKARGAMLVLRP